MKMDFGGTIEDVVTKQEFPMEKALETLKDETLAIIGYGVQGQAQALNLRDNGFNVIIGQRKGGKSWDKAVADGWASGETLFSIEEGCKRGTILFYLLSDAGQKVAWPTIKPYLVGGKTLCFAHGFSLVYKDQTNVDPPQDIDVILVAPKGPGVSLRKLFAEGKGVNSSYAIHQDSSGSAREKALAIGMGIGSGFLFETTFEKEVYSDLTGERGVLVGAVCGIMEAQYSELRKRGHSPSEAFNETVEEATRSLIPLINEQGMDWMLANCSTTAQRGALDWRHEFRAATAPVFGKLYDSVKDGTETRIVLEANSTPDYREKLEAELKEMHDSEMWRAGETTRKLRPENS